MAVHLSNLSLFAILLLAGSTSLATDSPALSPITGAIGGEECKDTLVSASPCLPYISAPPNNESSSAPHECCDAFTSIFYAGDVSCLCYFLRDPPVLGFPIDRSRLLSLSSLCPLPNVTSPRNGASMEFICSVLQTLPPLGNAGDGTPDFPFAGPEASPPSITNAPDSSPSSMIITPEASNSPPSPPPDKRNSPPPDLESEYPPDLDTEYPDTSSATKLRSTYSGFMNLLAII